MLCNMFFFFFTTFERDTFVTGGSAVASQQEVPGSVPGWGDQGLSVRSLYG